MAEFTCGGTTTAWSGTANTAAVETYGGVEGHTCDVTTTYPGEDVAYRIDSATDRTVEVFYTDDSGAPFDPSLYTTKVLRFPDSPDGCNPGACLTDAEGGYLSFGLTGETPHFAILDRLTVSGGTPYRFHARCIDGATCSGSNLVCHGAPFRCNPSGSAWNTYTGCGVDSHSWPGPERVFAIKVATAQAVSVYVTTGEAASRYEVFVVQQTNGVHSCATPRVSACVASSVAHPYAVASFQAEANVTYCAIVDSDVADFSDYFVISLGCF